MQGVQAQMKDDRERVQALPGYLQRATKASEKQRATYVRKRYGKLGKAGPCRRLDPVTGEVIEVVRRPARRAR
jgi:hypothetical protein